jgi:hypothetical protein
MPSYALLPARAALTCALPPGGLSVQLVGRLAHADAEDAYAELATAPPSLAPATLLPLHTHLVPAEDLPAPPAAVHVFGLLQDRPRAGASAGALARVLRVDLLRAVEGVDLALLERTLAARAALLGPAAGGAAAAPAVGEADLSAAEPAAPAGEQALPGAHSQERGP